MGGHLVDHPEILRELGIIHVGRVTSATTESTGNLLAMLYTGDAMTSGLTARASALISSESATEVCVCMRIGESRISFAFVDR